MPGHWVTPFVLANAITLTIAAQAQAQDVAAGERVFKASCGICHSPQPGRNLVGPSLCSRSSVVSPVRFPTSTIRMPTRARASPGM